MAKPRAIAHKDRIVNTSTGEQGTVVDVHAGSKKKGAETAARKHYGVLLDDGPRMLVVWEEEVTERTSGPVSDCKRCSTKGHTAIDCDRGDL